MFFTFKSLFNLYFIACINKLTLCNSIKYRSFNLWIAIGEKFAWDTQSRSNGYVRHKHKRVIVYIYYVTLLRGVSLDFNTDEKTSIYKRFPTWNPLFENCNTRNRVGIKPPLRSKFFSSRVNYLSNLERYVKYQ